MNHDQHDPDLIAAFAGGDADDASAAEAERFIATCPDCRAEFDLHREVSAWLASAPPVSLTSDERTAMRAGVRAGIARGGEVVQLSPMRRWTAIGSVAATLFVLVGVIGLLSQLSNGASTSAPVEAAARILENDSSASDLAETQGLAGASPATTAAAAETTLAPATAESILTDLRDVTKAELNERVADQIARLRADGGAEPITAKRLNDSERPVPECFPVDQDVYAITEASVDNILVEVFVVGDTAGDFVVEAFDAATCDPFPLN
jgi:hypothetical protein